MSVESATNSDRARRTTGFNPTNPKTTIMCWFRTNTLVDFRIMWDHGSNSSPLLLAIADPGDFFFFNGDVDLATMTNNIVGATWYFAAVVLDTTVPVKIYWAKAGDALTLTQTSDPFVGFLGTELILYNELSVDETLSGQLTALKIWSGANGALTQQQIENEYKRLTPEVTTNLYAFVPLLNAPTAGLDVSGNGHDFTVEGTLTTQRTMPPAIWQPGGGGGSYISS